MMFKKGLLVASCIFFGLSFMFFAMQIVFGAEPTATATTTATVIDKKFAVKNQIPILSVHDDCTIDLHGKTRDETHRKMTLWLSSYIFATDMRYMAGWKEAPVGKEGIWWPDILTMINVSKCGTLNWLIHHGEEGK